MTPREIVPPIFACVACPLRRLPQFEKNAVTEIDEIQRFKRGETRLDAGDMVYAEGEKSPYIFTVLEGWSFRFKTLSDGRRQIVNYALPGDLIGLQNSSAVGTESGIEALTAMRLCVFRRDSLLPFFGRAPELALDITWLAAREEMQLDANLTSIGRRTALERVAFLLWHLHARGREAGLTQDDTIRLPLKQQHLADTLGMSLVHLNKTLQALRRTGAISFAAPTLTIRNRARLLNIAKIDGKRPDRRPLI